MDILGQINALGNGSIGLDEAEETDLLFAAGAEIERLRSALNTIAGRDWGCGCECCTRSAEIVRSAKGKAVIVAVDPNDDGSKVSAAVIEQQG